MEVGAVKQAFNNETILLKKKLNQAKIQVIHKLTRKAKTLTEKKAPEHLKEKLKRKAESAINEVLIMKKIKARDITKFIVTHTGEVKDYLNRPKVDNDKACARLVLHKALQDKYKFIRNRFGNVPIKDLFMSRQERRKLKKEAREQQKNRKKGKEDKVVNAEGDWDVEDVEMGDDSKEVSLNEIDSDEHSNNGSVHSEAENNKVSDIEDVSEVVNNLVIENMDSSQSAPDNSDNDNEAEVGKFVKLEPSKEIKKHEVSKSMVIPKTAVSENVNKKTNLEIGTFKPKLQEKKQIDKKVKENKNKNLNEKLHSRKFKKDADETQIEGRKIVDPFFITATGENYLSLAEPRAPDEVKEIHKQGNRKERRAALFGHVPKIKSRKDDSRNFRSNNFKNNNNRENDNNSFNSRDRNDRYNNGSNNDANPKFNQRSAKFNDRNTNFTDRNANVNDRNNKFDDGNSKFNDRKFKDNINVPVKEEKLHPSWEAKKKLSSILPFKGKKIVFDES